MPTITFLPSGVTIDVKPGTTVFHAAARAEVAIPSQCGGKCACALCRVCLVTTDPAVSPMRWEEEGHLGNAFFITRERLSCQLQVFGDVTVEVASGPVKEKKARYIPRSIIRKRERMEREDDQRRATKEQNAGSRPNRGGRDDNTKKPGQPKRRRGGRPQKNKG